jgi:hypothetical protein
MPGLQANLALLNCSEHQSELGMWRGSQIWQCIPMMLMTNISSTSGLSNIHLIWTQKWKGEKTDALFPSQMNCVKCGLLFLEGLDRLDTNFGPNQPSPIFFLLQSRNAAKARFMGFFKMKHSKHCMHWVGFWDLGFAEVGILNVTEKVSDSIKSSVKTVAESAKIHVFPIGTADSMRAETRKLQTQEKKVKTREAWGNHGGCLFSVFFVAKLAMQSEICVSRMVGRARIEQPGSSPWHAHARTAHPWSRSLDCHTSHQAFICHPSKDQRLFHLSSKDQRQFHLSFKDERWKMKDETRPRGQLGHTPASLLTTARHKITHFCEYVIYLVIW